MIFTTSALLILLLLFALLFLLLVKDRRERNEPATGIARRRNVEGPRAEQLSAPTDTRSVIGQRVVGWSRELGGEGPQCPGYFGLKLQGPRGSAWLLVAVRNAAEWLLCDGRWVAAPIASYGEQKPLYSAVPGHEWDRLSERIVGAKLAEMATGRHRIRVVLEKNLQRVTLEVPSDTDLLPRLPSGRTRRLHPDDDLTRSLYLRPIAPEEEPEAPPASAPRTIPVPA